MVPSWTTKLEHRKVGQSSVLSIYHWYAIFFSSHKPQKTGTDRFLENTANTTNELRLIISFITQWHRSSRRAHLSFWWTIADNMFQLRRNLQWGLSASYNTCQIPVDTSYGLLIREKPSLGETLPFPQFFFVVSTKTHRPAARTSHFWSFVYSDINPKGERGGKYEFLNRYSVWRKLNDCWKTQWLQTGIAEVCKTDK